MLGHLRSTQRYEPIPVEDEKALAISIEAGLSYPGLGIQPPTATWGTMLRDAQRYLYLAPWYTLAPGVMIFVVILVLNFFGDRLSDALDPRLKRV